ncbi:hypothetical protein OIE66_14910 [Nonomuraea sp. NBC_01738]|uniref:hypothetical protein n=1 Tax=Nonomuraea sp. NBC_01738 TaxID=2976003 RepID=UPI002E14FA4F|nr:hypothetical protein OIE66_14910 [Nonomuraea sp. NBC_01738]
MTSRVLLASIAAGALTAPMPVSAAATELAIREITVRPADPVVGATGSVRLVIDVVAKGVQDAGGVTIKVDPGDPPGRTLPPQPHVEAPPAQVEHPAGQPDPRPAAEPQAVTPEPAVEAPASTPAPAVGEPAPDAGTPAPAVETPTPTPAVEVPSAGVVAPAPAAQAPAAQEPAVPAPDAATAPVVGGAARAVPGTAGQRRGDGWETWRFLPEKGLNRFYPSGTWTIAATARSADGRTVTEYATFRLRRETRLTSVKTSKVRGAHAVRLRGQLSRIDPQGYTDFAAFGNQRVEILHRRDGARTWDQVAVATTAASGGFTRTVRGVAGGHWKVRFPGNSHYAADQSTVHQTRK